MAEILGLPATACGEALRRVIEARRRRARRVRIAIAAALAAVPCAVTVAVTPPILLVWNASASVPLGLYRVAPGAKIHRGDNVIASLREPYRTLAARRGYLPAGVPLVKAVAAIPGDGVCARGSTLSIAGKAAVVRKALDSKGRRLPAWRGCAHLRSGEYLLLGDTGSSFDGRYTGPTRASDIIGRAVLLWRA